MSSGNEVDVSLLVRLVYEAAIDSGKWGVFLAAFAGRMRSPTGMIYANDFSNRTVQVNIGSVNFGWDPAYVDTFLDYYGARNVWAEDARLHREGSMVTDEMLYSPARLKSTEYWTDWLRPQDLFHTAAAIVERRDGRTVNLTVVRSEAAGPYDAEEREVVSALIPHLQTGFSVMRRLHRLEAVSRASTIALEMLPFGVALVDANANVLFANRLAKSFARDGGLIRLSETAGFGCSRSQDHVAIRLLIQRASRTGADGTGSAGGFRRLRGVDGRQLHLVVTPLPSWSTPFGMEAVSAIFMSDPRAAPQSLAAALLNLYGMTPVEARLTESLVSGLSTTEYAARFDVSMNTVRTQIKAAAAKAGVSRQADLVRVVLSGLAMFRPLELEIS